MFCLIYLIGIERKKLSLLHIFRLREIEINIFPTIRLALQLSLKNTKYRSYTLLPIKYIVDRKISLWIGQVKWAKFFLGAKLLVCSPK